MQWIFYLLFSMFSQYGVFFGNIKGNREFARYSEFDQRTVSANIRKILLNALSFRIMCDRTD